MLSSLVQAVVRCGPLFSVHGNLVVSFARSATMQTRSFSVVGPTTWNGLPIDRKHLQNGRLTPVLNSTTFSRLLFSAWPGSGAPLITIRDLEGALYKF